MPALGRPRTSEYINHICRTCSSHFVRPEYAKSGTIYCSAACCYVSRRGKPRPDLKIDPVLATCGFCKETFLTGGRGRRPYDAKFCSAKCHGRGQSTQPDLRDMSSEETAWLAGLFDGEGNIAWPRKGTLHTVRVSITNTNFALLNRVVEVTGTGAIVGLKQPQKPQHTLGANWNCYGDRAKSLLRRLRPWLIVKAESADIALQAADAREAEVSAKEESYS